MPECDSWREEPVLRYLYRDRGLPPSEIAEWAPEEISSEAVRSLIKRRGIKRESERSRNGLARELEDIGRKRELKKLKDSS